MAPALWFLFLPCIDSVAMSCSVLFSSPLLSSVERLSALSGSFYFYEPRERIGSRRVSRRAGQQSTVRRLVRDRQRDGRASRPRRRHGSTRTAKARGRRRQRRQRHPRRPTRPRMHATRRERQLKRWFPRQYKTKANAAANGRKPYIQTNKQTRNHPRKIGRHGDRPR